MKISKRVGTPMPGGEMKLYPAPFQGKHHTEETKERIGRSSSGRHPSQATLKKMSEVKKGKPNPMEGRHHSYATKKRMSVSAQGISEEEWVDFKKNHPYCWKWTDPELKIKKRVRAFFKGRCVECGKVREPGGYFLSVHHVSRNRDACCTGETFEWLFIVLCRKHHRIAEANPETYIPKYKRMIKEQYGGKCYYTLVEFDDLVERGVLKSSDWGRKDGW